MRLHNTHMRGLEEIIRLRGGVDTLESNPVLRNALIWYVYLVNFSLPTCHYDIHHFRYQTYMRFLQG
jgi:hypothetical protein